MLNSHFSPRPGHTDCEVRKMKMSGFLKGMALGAVAGAAAEMALQTSQGKKTKAGRAAQAATNVVDSAATAIKETLEK